MQNRIVETIEAQGLDREKLVKAYANIEQLEANALDRLKTVPPDFWTGIYLGTSGGKDSVAINHLMSKTDYSIQFSLHTNKPNDTHPLTVTFLYTRKYPILYVPKGIDLPKYLKTQIDGTRASEYNREDGRSTDVVVGGILVSRNNMPLFVRNGLFGLNFVFPIFDWTDEEVWAYIFSNNIEYSDEYLIHKSFPPLFTNTDFNSL